ncbi:MAG TPA: amidohydrolase family protein [Baekduia sp.]|jgi:hypothetical protein
MALKPQEEHLVDVDVHHTWADDAELLPYLPARWRTYFESVGSVLPAATYYSRIGGSAMRLDATPPGGGAPGSDYAMLCEHHLDAYDIDRALLTFGFGTQGAWFHPAGGVALCRAANDWTLDRWLSLGDDRLYGLMMLPPGDPVAAAAELRRVGGHPRIAGALMVPNPLGQPMGHPVNDPIYDAAVEVGIPVVTHVGSEFATTGTLAAGGLPSSKPEYYTLLEQPGMHHLASLLAGGTFARFPRLRVLFNEHGFLWVPWVLWGLDARYAALRRERPELDRLPSEYFREHVWMGTQPFETGAGRQAVTALLEAFGGMEDRLCFASDYPHWDTDPPPQVSARLPRVWRAKVMGGNAAELFGWSLPSRERRRINATQEATS